MTRDDQTRLLTTLHGAGLLTGTVAEAARVLERGPKPANLLQNGGDAVHPVTIASCVAQGDRRVVVLNHGGISYKDCITLRDWLDSVIAWHIGVSTPKRMTAAAIAERLVCARQNILYVAGAGIHPYDSNTGAAAAERSVRGLVATALREMGVAE